MRPPDGSTGCLPPIDKQYGGGNAVLWVGNELVNISEVLL